MNRRGYLAAAGATLFTFAGCSESAPSDDGSEDTVTANSTASGTATATPTPGASLSLALDALQPALVTYYVDSFSLADDGQYLVLTVDATGSDAPEPAEFGFHFDGTVTKPLGKRDDNDYPQWRVRNGPPRYSSGASGWLTFRLPERGDASDATLRWPGGEWRPSEHLRERLAAAQPTFDVALSVPETATSDSAPTARVTVTNEGDRAGRFVGALNRQGGGVAYAPLARLSMFLAPGESRTQTATASLLRTPSPETVGDGETDMWYSMLWDGGDASQGVRFVSESG